MLRNCRKRTGLTQRQLAQVSDMYQNEISRIELGRQDPTLSRVMRMAKGLGVELLPIPVEHAAHVRAAYVEKPFECSVEPA